MHKSWKIVIKIDIEIFRYHRLKSSFAKVIHIAIISNISEVNIFYTELTGVG